MILQQITWDVSPVLFSIGNFQLRFYSLFFALGFILGYMIVKRFFKREDIPVKELDNLLIYVVVGGLAGQESDTVYFMTGHISHNTHWKLFFLSASNHHLNSQVFKD